MWDRAKKIAKAMLDGQLWLPEVAKSTHYHAYWVRPSWVHEMKKMYKFGVHTFYRPRAWGDGSEAPSWGNAGADRGDLREARRSRARARPRWANPRGIECCEALTALFARVSHKGRHSGARAA